MPTHVVLGLLLGLVKTSAVKDPEIPIVRYQLNNGLKVVLSPDHSAPVVTTYITYRVGAAQEVKGRTGFAHLFEHMMFNGSDNVPEGAYSYYVDGTGGILNGNTEPDRTNYFQTVPSNFLEGMLWLEASRMAGLQLTPDALNNEKDVVKEEVRQQQENQPFARALLLDFPAAAFSSWEYSHSIYGSMEDLSNAPAQAFVDFFERFYVPNNAVLVICGDFELEKAKALVETHFGPLARGPENTTKFPVEPKQTAQVIKQVNDPLAPIPAALVSFDIPEPRTPDRDALELLAAVLADGSSAPLPKRLVDEEKLAAGVVVQAGFPFKTYGPGQLVSLLIANKDVTLENLRKSFWAELDRVKEKGVSARDLVRAKAKLRKQHVDGMGRTLFKAQQLATYETFYGGADKLAGDLARYEKIKLADLTRVAKTYLTRENSVTLDIVPGAGLGAMGGK